MKKENINLQTEPEPVSGGIGIQKYEKPEDVFKFLHGSWGEEACETESKLIIADDETFRNVIYVRAITRAFQYLFGVISKEKCRIDLALSDEKSTDYLVDFNFLLYSQEGNCYYVSHMDFKDDGASVWDKKQWGYFYELAGRYSFSLIGKRAMELAEFYYDLHKPDDIECALEIISNEEGIDLCF